MAKYRHDRINDAVAQEAALILRDVRDPRVADAMLSVTGAVVAPDLKQAKIFVSPLAEVDERELAKSLRKIAGHVRSELAKRLNLRMTPELTFALDDSIRHGAHITELLRQIEPEGGYDADAGEDDDE